jgi:NAD+ synthase (glutamine-hydrolysing)
MTHKNCNYNCRVIIYNGKIVLVRPKMWMANDGNYASCVSLRHLSLMLQPADSLARTAPLHPLVQAPAGRGSLTAGHDPQDHRSGKHDPASTSLPAGSSMQTMVPFGDAVVGTEDSAIGVELCEELFTPAS